MWLTVGEIGTNLDFTVYRRGAAVDLTGLTPSLRVRAPGATAEATLTMTAIDLATGQVRRTTADANEFNVVGAWDAQIRFQNGGGTVVFRTLPFKIDVRGNIV